ncbi:hypothetical protein [Thermodesulfovibrio yellowstonii]|uniref:Uncharacterized protein n=1 Tax=Thermodesulfovibrio yellowstonii (strain ATCC 51303 / DSM 11347 / YP87) TaxID=289376 RepID=B5YFQ3_THEYD|nr:hypothetical protein [Thermodesulfovibrio yellowstonii]ACI21737.1 hypothetical protein THEYE_A1287 [Thermodesulfovibrio yellowstonii DSM 11347]
MSKEVHTIKDRLVYTEPLKSGHGVHQGVVAKIKPQKTISLDEALKNICI